MKNFNLHTYLVIGMSPGNSYFSQETIEYLLKTVVGWFGRTSILIPDIPAIATYEALGYSSKRARSDKAIPKGNALRNKVSRAMQKLGYDNHTVRVFDWEEDIASEELYSEQLREIESLYERSDSFQKAIRLATREVLLSSGQKPTEIENAIDRGVHYILSEFACLEFLSEHLQVSKIIYIYHKSWPVYESYIAGDFDQTPKTHLGFLKINKETA